jgi:hypothetical protein
VPLEVEIGFGRSSVWILLIALQQTEALGTAIASSGDQSDALAGLKRIALGDGVQLPTVDFGHGQFVADTPEHRSASQRMLAQDVDAI